MRVLFKDFLLVNEGKIQKSSLLTENEYIKEISDTISNGDCDFVVEGNGAKFLTPGFIDIHVHGGAGFDYMDASSEEYAKIGNFHLLHGTTTIIPTILPGDDNEVSDVIDAFNKSVSEKSDIPSARTPGLHFEGPFVSKSAKGALDERYIKDINTDVYRSLYSKNNHVMRVTLAPELDGAVELVEFLSENGIIASAGHTDAVYDDVLSAFKAGLRMSTHLYSAMTQTRRIGINRYAGAVEAVYLIDDICTELIADGIHLPYELLRLAYKNKGPDKIALITDAMRGAGMPDGPSILGSRKYGQKVFIEDDVAKLPDRTAFAGSVATTDRLMRTAIDAGIDFADVIKMMTVTPAKIMNLKSVGELKATFLADLNIISEDKRNVEKTFLGGIDVKK